MRALSVPGDSESTEEQVTTLRMLCRLWCHENTRVYADRLGDSRDRMWFLRLLEACIKCCFCGVNLQAPPTAPRQPLGGYTATKGERFDVCCRRFFGSCHWLYLLTICSCRVEALQGTLSVCLSRCLSVCVIVCLSVYIFSCCLPMYT